MHGLNVIRPMQLTDSLQIADIWYTIQGEGPFYGMPAVFVRLTGCNLGCTFCDTEWDDENDRVVKTLDVANDVLTLCYSHNCKLVVLTGGEPVRQDCGPLVDKLRHNEITVQVETAGTYYQEWLHKCLIVVSPKTQYVHPKVAELCAHWKYVIRHGDVDDSDGLPGAPTQADKYKFGRPYRVMKRPGITIWLSPCDEEDDFENDLNRRMVAMLSMRHGYRAQVQLHKILGVQ